jgi:phage terminase large subunit-like protein
LERWQEFIIRSLFGWKRSGGFRRFRFGYLQMGRKNGKTQTAAGVGLLLTVADREPGAEVYTAATKRDQAKLAFDEAARMVRTSPLIEFVEVIGGRRHSRTNNIYCSEIGSLFEPLAADDEKQDGLGPHGVLADELHKWKNPGLWEVLETGMGARTQPLFFQITTPGAGLDGVCWEQREYCGRVLEGDLQDDQYFAYIAEPPPDADWSDPETWEMGNPNIGVSLQYEDLHTESERAKEQPSRIGAFRRLRCGQWTTAVERWIDAEKWKACGGEFDPDMLIGRPCYGGLDLASTTDLAAWSLWFPPIDDRPWSYIIGRYWVPQERVERLARVNRKPYQQWIDDGLLLATDGDVIDYDAIRAQVNADSELYEIQEIGFDPWNAANLVNDLQERDGFTMVKVSQAVGGMSAPSKEFERLVCMEFVRHGDHPVLTWAAGNVSIWTDANENIKPSRKSSGGRIDPIVAAIISLSRAMLHGDNASVYEDRGIL